MSFYLAMLLIAPLAVLVAGGPSVRFALIVTSAVTWAGATAARHWFVPDPSDVARLLLFYWGVLHAMCALASGTFATILLGLKRSFGVPIGAGLVGSVLGLLLWWHVAPQGDIHESALEVMASALISSAFAVAAANLGKRRT